MFNSVRVRLTLWYMLVFGGLLVGFSLFIYTVLSRNLYSRLDHSLSNDAATVARTFQNEAEENRGNTDAGAVQTLNELRLPDVRVAIYAGDRLLASDYPEGQQFPL